VFSFANLHPKSTVQMHFTATMGHALTNAQIIMRLHKHTMGMNQCWLLGALFSFLSHKARILCLDSL